MGGRKEEGERVCEGEEERIKESRIDRESIIESMRGRDRERARCRESEGVREIIQESKGNDRYSS